MLTEYILVTIAVIIGVVAVARHLNNGNPYGAAVWIIFIGLYHMQAYFIAGDLETNSTVIYNVENLINHEGFFWACVLLLLATATAWISEVLFSISGKRRQPLAPSDARIVTFEKRPYLKLAFFALQLALSAWLVKNAGGVDVWLQSSRPGGVSGTFGLLVILTLFLVPALSQIARRQRLTPLEILMLLVTLGVSMTFARIFALVQILTIVCCFYVHRQPELRQKKFRLMLQLVGVLAIALGVFMGWGSIRDAQGRAGVTTKSSGASISDAIRFLRENPDESILNLKFNYVISIEGMSSLAGAVSSSDPATPDLGVSAILETLFRVVPGFLRGGIDLSWAQDLFWYHNAVVASGLTCLFVHFHFFGAFIFGFGIGWFSTFAVRSAQRAANQRRYAAYVRWCLIMALVIFFIRGTFAIWLYLTIYSLAFWFLFQKLYAGIVVPRVFAITSPP